MAQTGNLQFREPQIVQPYPWRCFLSWNITAQSLYEKGQLFSKQDVIPWSLRLEWILQRLQTSNADIICLQEVEDEEVFARDLLLAMQSWGYQGVLLQGGPNS